MTPLPARHPLRVVAAVCLATALAAAQNDPQLSIETWRGQPVVAGEVLVRFRDDATQLVQDDVHEALGAQRIATLTARTGLVRAPGGVPLDLTLERYARDPAVEFAYPNTIHAALAPTAGTANDPLVVSQWGLANVGAFGAWDVETGDADVVVAIIDSGVDTDHPDLAAQIAWGLDTYGGDGDPDDLDGHGTHCAGIAAAVTDNATGVAGLARGCRLAAYRAGNASFPSSTLIAAIEDARVRGAHVLSMSWGSYGNNPAIEAALADARDDGCVLVAAAGNDGTAQKLYPAALDFVIAVGATKKGDLRASFSNHGNWVSVAAPGQQITSTYKNGLYATLNGTSMATPLVAGAAALVYSRLGGARSPGAAALVRDALEDTAVDVGNWVAHGRIDVPAALAAVQPPAPSEPPVITSVEPSVWPALGGTTVTLHGSHLSGVDAVAVDGAAALGATVAPLSDDALTFVTGDAPRLGDVPLVATTDGIGSASTTVTVVETSPPAISIPSAIAPGAGFAWRLGGGADVRGVLLLSLSPDTTTFRQQPLLTHFSVLWIGLLDGAGLHRVDAVCPHGVGGLTFHSQLATIDDDGHVATSAVTTTTIAN